MSNPNTSHKAVPSIDDLMARFLASSVVTSELDAASDTEVEPHEVIGGFRAAATQLWRECLAVFAGVANEKVSTPPEWAAFVALESHQSSPFAAGFFPQSLREISPLWNRSGLNSLRSTGKHSAVAGFTTLRSWCQKNITKGNASTLLVTSGILAGLGDFAEAKKALQAAESLCDGEMRTLWLNQQAAILWMAGETEQAVAKWSQLEENLVARFNLGLAELLAGEKQAAAQHLSAAANGLPESSGWCHIARLYSALAS